MTRIIAFGGRKQSGKTTSGEYVETLLNTCFFNGCCKLYNFADPLKRDICINILGLTEQQCYGSDEDKNIQTKLRWIDMPGYSTNEYAWPTKSNAFGGYRYMTAREVMEFVGTGVFRKIYENVWVDATMRKIQRDKPDFAVILDCRFSNEAVAIKDKEGINIKLLRDLFNSTAKSECGLDPENCDQSLFDLFIPKDVSIEDRNVLIYNFLNTKLELGLISR